MKYVLFFLFSFCLLSCGSGGSIRNDSVKWYTYEGSDISTEMKAKLKRINKVCVYREFTYRWVSGLRANPLGDNPKYVQAFDYDCDGWFDRFRFRDWLEKQRSDERMLQDKMNHLYYGLVPIWNHPKILR